MKKILDANESDLIYRFSWIFRCDEKCPNSYLKLNRLESAARRICEYGYGIMDENGDFSLTEKGKQLVLKRHGTSVIIN